MAAGIGLSLVAAFLFASGNILEKRAVDTMPSFSLQRIMQSAILILRAPIWVMGAFVSVLGVLVQIFAYHFVSISIVQILSVVGVVLVLIVSRVHFHETLNSLEAAGLATCVIAFVFTMLSLTGGGTSPGKAAPLLTVGIVTAATVACVIALLTSLRLHTRHQDFVFGCTSGLMYGLVGLSSKGLSTVIAGSAGFDRLVGTLHSIYLVLMPLAWFVALLLFQVGLQRGRVGVIGPLSGAISAIFLVAVGTPIFGEHMPANGLAFFMRLTGFVGILLGSVMMSWKPLPARDDDVAKVDTT